MRLGPVSEKAVYRNLTLLDEGPPDDLVSFATSRWLLDEGHILISSIKVEVKKKHPSHGRTFSCFAAHLIEQDLF